MKRYNCGQCWGRIGPSGMWVALSWQVARWRWWKGKPPRCHLCHQCIVESPPVCVSGKSNNRRAVTVCGGVGCNQVSLLIDAQLMPSNAHRPADTIPVWTNCPWTWTWIDDSAWLNRDRTWTWTWLMIKQEHRCHVGNFRWNCSTSLNLPILQFFMLS